MGEANATGAAAAVRVLAVTRVAPAERGAGAGEGGRVKLSFFDTRWVGMPPVQLLFLYELPGDASQAPLKRLKDSLAATLALYLPLAGKLEYVAESGDVFADCTDDPGVAFVEAEADAMDVRRLATDESHDIPAFLALVAGLDTAVLPAPVLSVQATRLPAGLALGVSIHHAIADGEAFWRFVRAWAAAAREGSPVTKALCAPHYDRGVVGVPNGDEFAREMLRKVAPNLPVVRNLCLQDNTLMDIDFSQRFRLGRRTFHLADDDIRSLKRHIDALAAAEEEEAAGDSTTTSSKKKPVSTFVVLAALGWTAFVRSKSLAAGDDTYLVFHADLRARLDPPIADGYLGNCIRSCLACADAGDLVSAGVRGLLGACRAIQVAVEEMEAAPLGGMERWIEKMMSLPFPRVCNVVGSPRFRVYGASDFGFGRPARVELVSMNRDGEMVLVAGREDCEVQVSVSLDPARMEEFKAHLLAAPAPAN